jgi:hypothetical protein
MKLFFTSAAISVFTAFCLTIAGQTRASDCADYKQLNLYSIETINLLKE